ncbi:hypothetical protein JX265_009349 [Neoarthrinium moseri]|uniref:Uncharacterized protein n=1 Tax=Neoarthrinium moseri TaxID=1658444 RepID=A0A9P9WGC6_9PEZI|nr:hypothetical protein JX265_009349 [Neoarthrinium moseri]
MTSSYSLDLVLNHGIICSKAWCAASAECIIPRLPAVVLLALPRGQPDFEPRITMTMPDTAKDTVLSLLCGPDLWHWDPRGSCSISFHKNGTGLVRLPSLLQAFLLARRSILTIYQLRAGAEISDFIAAGFDWELKRPESLNHIVDLNQIDERRGTLLSQFEVELTLTTRVHPRLQETRHLCTLLNEQALTDGAFLPKFYTIRLEYGRFDDPSTSWMHDPPALYRPPKYALRLLFDKSPFPAREEWNDEARFPAEQCRFWDMREFAQREVPKDGWPTTLIKKLGMKQ